ncbi:MAG: hypothetical protein A3G25_09050 [Betaproteobacteria bacterium RIFCSPLOWO2_12_FULL_63_13]|nr:MAG: hypothetical protein A3G25_09050 [Betaproteobacteria bacterium RIFCSPLOWO2_12_FULL_63_13]
MTFLARRSRPVRRHAVRIPVWLLVLCLGAPLATQAATVWTGPRVVFTKADGTDSKQAANQDRLTSNVWLTRGGSQGLYNAARETFFSHNLSPADTEWATGTTANYASLTYTNWETWAKSVGSPPGPPATVGVNAVLHLKTDDIYLDIKFLSWSVRPASGTGFSYERSTPGTGMSNVDCLFNWAESTYPELLAPPAASATTAYNSADYYYRHYTQTNAYVGTSSVDNHVYYLGPISANELLDLGPLSTWLATSGCQ